MPYRHWTQRCARALGRSRQTHPDISGIFLSPGVQYRRRNPRCERALCRSAQNGQITYWSNYRVVKWYRRRTRRYARALGQSGPHSSAQVAPCGLLALGKMERFWSNFWPRFPKTVVPVSFRWTHRLDGRINFCTSFL